ncbi:MAG: hypothetical protein Q8L11_03295 [Candidatus Moranbacteria bacterium]|nr:hypothetical protein [Candidatus Moranbacteria bacterium]
MKGIERVYCDFAIRTVLGAALDLMQTPVAEVLKKQKIGKRDTLGMDAVPENSIREAVDGFFINPVLVTEETDHITRKHWPEDSDPDKQPLMFFSDPLDRSAKFGRFLRTFPDICGKSEIDLVGDVIACPEANSYWEKEIDNISPIMISGATISLTCVNRGNIVVSVVMNIMTRTIFVACLSGTYAFCVRGDVDQIGKIHSTINLKAVERKGKKISFCSSKNRCENREDFLRFVSFVGKTGYEENLTNSGILPDYRSHLYHDCPGGPSRILFLSDFQSAKSPIGFIMANGEKIGEWIHWLAYVKFAKDIQGKNSFNIYEVSLAQTLAKESILMSPLPPYSIFRHKSNSARSSFLNISRLRDLDRPSNFRSTVIVTKADNMRVKNIMYGKGFHDVSASL